MKQPYPTFFSLEGLLPNLPLPNGRLPFLVTFVFSAIRACAIILITLSPISNADVPDFIPNLHPSLTAGWNRRNLAEGPVRQAGDDETCEEVDIVNVFSTRRHRLPNGAHKSDDVDKDTADVCCIASPVEAESKIIRCRFAG